MVGVLWGLALAAGVVLFLRSRGVGTRDPLRDEGLDPTAGGGEKMDVLVPDPSSPTGSSEVVGASVRESGDAVEVGDKQYQGATIDYSGSKPRVVTRELTIGGGLGLASLLPVNSDTLKFVKLEQLNRTGDGHYWFAASRPTGAGAETAFFRTDKGGRGPDYSKFTGASFSEALWEAVTFIRGTVPDIALSERGERLFDNGFAAYQRSSSVQPGYTTQAKRDENGPAPRTWGVDHDWAPELFVEISDVGRKQGR